MSKALAKTAAKRSLPPRLVAKLRASLTGSLDQYSDHTRRSYRCGLVEFARWLADEGAIMLDDEPASGTEARAQWRDDTIALGGAYLLSLEQHESTLLVEAWLHDLVIASKTATRATASMRLAAVRWAVREARRLGKVKWTLDAKMPRARKGRSGRIEEKAGRDMRGPTPAEADRILVAATASTDPQALPILSLIRYEGYREHEIAQIDVGDLDLARRKVMLTRKKRERPESHPLSIASTTTIRAWLDMRGDHPGPLFIARRHGRGSEWASPMRRITIKAIFRLVRQVCSAAGLPNQSPHRIRHRACTDIVRAGQGRIPEEELLFLTGHSNRSALRPYYEASKSRADSHAVLDSMPHLPREDDL